MKISAQKVINLISTFARYSTQRALYSYLLAHKKEEVTLNRVFYHLRTEKSSINSSHEPSMVLDPKNCDTLRKLLQLLLEEILPFNERSDLVLLSIIADLVLKSLNDWDWSKGDDALTKIFSCDRKTLLEMVLNHAINNNLLREGAYLLNMGVIPVVVPESLLHYLVWCDVSAIDIKAYLTHLSNINHLLAHVIIGRTPLQTLLDDAFKENVFKLEVGYLFITAGAEATHADVNGTNWLMLLLNQPRASIEKGLKKFHLNEDVLFSLLKTKQDSKTLADILKLSKNEWIKKIILTEYKECPQIQNLLRCPSLSENPHSFVYDNSRQGPNPFAESLDLGSQKN